MENTETKETTEVNSNPANETPQKDPAFSSALDSMAASFEDAFNVGGSEEQKGTESKTPEKPAEIPAEDDEGDDTKDTEEKPQPDQTEDDFDQELLNIELKRHDKRMTLKEYIKKYPDEVKEIMQKRWDYDERKAEFLEQKQQEISELNARQRALDTVLLRNLSLEIGMEAKTLEDFESDTRVEDPEEEFAKYQEAFMQKARPILDNRRKAEAENLEMIEDFTKEYKGVDVKGLFEDLKPYLNSSVAMGFIPFPEDALKVFYRGRNYDTLVKEEIEKALVEERKKIYKEISSKPKNHLFNDAQSDKSKSTSEDRNSMNPMERAFLEAWDVG